MFVSNRIRSTQTGPSLPELEAERDRLYAQLSGAAQAAAARDRSAMITARKLVPLPPSPLPTRRPDLARSAQPDASRLTSPTR